MGFGEVPVKLYLRKREQTDRRDEIDAEIAKPAVDPRDAEAAD
jgi:hypothetical protein